MTRFAGLSLALLLLAAPILAQTALLRGAVTDQSGAIVPGAKVTLTGPEGSVKTALADDKGSYVFASLPPGEYTVTGAAPDLATSQPVKISLQPGAQTLNLQLQVQSTAEHVTVEESSGPNLSTDVANNASALVLRGDDLQALADDPDDLLADLQALAGPSAGPSGGSIFIDGFSGGELPPKESIREIRINQNPFSPEYDKLGYGRIEIFTKPGTDRFHGTMNYNYANDIWNSRNPYSAEKAPLLLNELEGDASGPINKRTSFNLDAQRNTVDNGSITNAVTLNPETLAIQPFFSVFKVPQRFTRLSPRIDYQLNDTNTLIFRYSFTHSDINGTGIGGFDLTSRGYDYQYTNQTLQVTDTAVFGSTINETRFQYFRSAQQRIATSEAPEIQVLGSFNEGGSQLGRSFDTQNYYELQNYTTIPKGAHVLKFGVRLRGQTDDNVSPLDFNGTFTFSSIDQYQRTLEFQQQGFSPAQIRAMGGGASQFTINAGMPELALHQVDVAAFAGDDWRVRPNVTVSAGLRYETQSNIHDWRDFAPRIAVAWAPGAAGANSKAKTVIRAGFGIFYDRFALANTLTADRYNGKVQQQFVVTNPDFFPNIPSLEGLQATPQAVQEISSQLRAPYIMQSSVSVERQLPAHTTLAVTYTNSHGLHELRSDDINTPLPGTYSPNVPGSGVFPLGQTGPVFLMESSGLYNQNQLITNINSRINSKFSLFGFYAYGHVDTDVNGAPTNPYNFREDYGPASYDRRHQININGSLVLPFGIRMSPNITYNSAPAFNVTQGIDEFGDTLFNTRPAFAPAGYSAPNCTQTIASELTPCLANGTIKGTVYHFLINPPPGINPIPEGYFRAFGQFQFNVRISRTWGFGEPTAPNPNRRGGDQGGGGRGPGFGQAAGGGPRGGGGARGGGGPGPGGFGGGDSSGKRYSLTAGIFFHNLFNNVNPGVPEADLLSPRFGESLNLQSIGGPFGTSFNRRIDLNVRFSF